MGSPENEPGRGRGETQHWRVIKEPFYIGETEVTVEQFRKFVNATNYVTDAERGVEDVYQRDYPAAGADETAACGGNARVMRGGSWLDPPDLYRMAKRFAFAPQGRRDFLGFRVVMKVKR